MTTRNRVVILSSQFGFLYPSYICITKLAIDGQKIDGSEKSGAH